MTLTTEQLRARAKFWREKAVEAKWESVSIAQDMLQNADAFDELAANREAQPVAWRHDNGPFAGIAITRAKSVADSWIAKGWTVTPLYTAPPSPAVPPEIPLTSPVAAEYVAGWNACRAAMLENIGKPAPQLDSVVTRHADKPVSGGYTLPDGFKLMPLEITDEIGEAIAMEARCCGGIALDIYQAALAAAPEGGNG